MTETKLKTKAVQIKVIKSTTDNTLVEFTLGGLIQRATIPSAEITDGKAPDEVLLAGIPYGASWELVALKANSILLANTLRTYGIWTFEDAMSNPNLVISALQAVYGVDLAALVKYARENK